MTLISFSVPVVHRVKLSRAGDKLTVGCKYVDRQFDIEEIAAFDAPTAVAWEQKYDFHIRHHRSTGRYFERLIEQPQDVTKVEMTELCDGYAFNFDWCLDILVDIVAEAQGIDELPANVELPDIWDGLAPLRSKDVAADLLAEQLELVEEFMQRFCLIDGAVYHQVPEPVAMVHERFTTPMPVIHPSTWIKGAGTSVLMMCSMADWDLAVKIVKDLGTRRGPFNQTVELRELHRSEFNTIAPNRRKCCLLNAFMTLLSTHHRVEPILILDRTIPGLAADDQEWVTKVFECIDAGWDDDVADDRLDKMVDTVLSLDLSPGLREFGETSRAFGIIRRTFMPDVSKAA